MLYIAYIKDILSERPDDTVWQYDTYKFITSLQGLLNRDKLVLFTEFAPETDRFWLKQFRESENEIGGEEFTSLHCTAEFFSTFEKEIEQCGLVVWDGNVPSTANVATTVCGADGYLPARGGSEFFKQITGRFNIEVKLDLCGKFTGKGNIPDTDIPSTESRKCDAYIWAAEKYLDKTNPVLMGCVPDAMSWEGLPFNTENKVYPDLGNACIPNLDYLVANKAFAFDLGMWEDEAPNDDPEQPLGTDVRTLKYIMTKQNARNGNGKIISIVGFVPWKIKYTTRAGCGHEPVPAEWQLVEILSAYNAVIDADAYSHSALANASAYMHYPLKERYENSRPKTETKFDSSKKYILFYVGDYDSAAWLSKFIPQYWEDEKRGEMPIMWCFNPNLSDRNPLLFDYLYRTRTDNDYIAAGDSGAGYLNPSLLYEPRVHSELPPNGDAWVEHNKRYFERFDISVTGFLLNGHYKVEENVMRDYAKFSHTGVGHNGYGDPTKLIDGVVFKAHTCDIGGEFTPTEDIVNTIKTALAESEDSFHIFRIVLCSPTKLMGVVEALKKECPECEMSDPHNFFRMVKEQL